jgi:hypothetical protein
MELNMSQSFLIGKGVFGLVVKGIEKSTKVLVALKKSKKT